MTRDNDDFIAPTIAPWGEDDIIPDGTLLLPDVAQETLPEPDIAPAVQEQDTVLIFGGGHVAQEIAVQAAHVGFVVDVLDCRASYADPKRFPHAHSVVHCPEYEQFESVYSLGMRHYVVIVTHSHEEDQNLLSLVLNSPVRYIGVIGTPRKKENMFAALRAMGAPDAELACVHCPIGVPVGAETPQEVAIAVVAELIAARSGCLRPTRPERRR